MEETTYASLRSAADNLIRTFDTDPEIQKFCVEHPTQSRLVKGMITRLVEVVSIVSSTPVDTRKFSRISVELSRISAWMANSEPARLRMSPDDRDAEGARLYELGWTITMITDYLAVLRQRRRGRPVTKKRITVTAHEYRALNDVTWPQVADKVCCGVSPADFCELKKRKERHKHETPCCQVLRQQVRQLDKFLSKYNL